MRFISGCNRREISVLIDSKNVSVLRISRGILQAADVSFNIGLVNEVTLVILSKIIGDESWV